MKTKYVLAVLLTISMLLFFLHSPLVNAADTSGRITWGTPLNVYQYFTIGENSEVPKGDYCYVMKEQVSGDKQVTYGDWHTMLSGDLSAVKSQIESQVPGTQVMWLSVSWAKAEEHHGTAYDSNGDPITIYYYVVAGFTVEAIVKNVNDGLEPISIIAILFAVAIVAVVLNYMLMSDPILWDIHTALQKLQNYGLGGILASLGIGIIVLIILLAAIIIVIVLVMGGKIGYKGKKRNFEIGKGS